MARKQRTEGEDAAIDMTPMLDIVFIMLIFFIVTTSFIKEAGIEVNKPQASQTEQQKNANVFIAITADGKIWLDKREMDVDRVRANLERLLAEQPTDIIIIQADTKAKHGVVIEVIEQIKAAGMEKIAVAAVGG
jgi:biopolymer transport protein ExbD